MKVEPLQEPEPPVEEREEELEHVVPPLVEFALWKTKVHPEDCCSAPTKSGRVVLVVEEAPLVARRSTWPEMGFQSVLMGQSQCSKALLG